MGDIIVLLPGIIGSVLQKDGRDLWALTYSAASQALRSRGSNFDLLRLDGDDHLINDLGDGVEATGLIRAPRLIPGFFKAPGYTKISELITHCFDVVKADPDEAVNDHTPANFFEFPYDWRRDNRVAARRLERLIGRRLEQWRRHRNPDAKVIIIAHSMGGLIARYYLEVLGGWEKCRALFTFGTPHRGSLNALDYLVNGFGMFFVDLTEVVRSCTSVYQLLPTYRAVKAGGVFYRVTEVTIPGLARERARAGLDFHEEIVRCVDSNRGGARYLEAGYVNVPLVGNYQPTLQSAHLNEAGLEASCELPEGVDGLLWHGDGTVPYLSAVPHEMWKQHRNVFYAGRHATLPVYDALLSFLRDQLRDLQLMGMENFRGAALRVRRRAALSVALDDLCWADEDFAATARVLEDGADLEDVESFREHAGGVVGTVARVDGAGPVLTRDLAWEGGRWRLSLGGLTPGDYLLDVYTVRQGETAPLPVRDYFVVATRTA